MSDLKISPSSFQRATSPISPTGGKSPAVNINQPDIRFHEEFRFPSKELSLEEREQQLAVPVEERMHRKILHRLFTRLLRDGLSICPRPPMTLGNSKKYVAEASFEPPSSKNKSKPFMYLPIRGLKQTLNPEDLKKIILKKDDVLPCIDEILKASTDEDILKLMVLAAHEYGHYKSYLGGNHDGALKTALDLFHQRHFNEKIIENYTWLVFQEECLAWDYGFDLLKTLSFKDWALFDFTKRDSLHAYFQALRLDLANINTSIKLGRLGDNYFNNTVSELFPKKKAPL